MELRFIGADGSLGLKYGKTYDVELKVYGRHMITIIKTGWISSTVCPYGSIQAFAKNWEL